MEVSEMSAQDETSEPKIPPMKKWIMFHLPSLLKS